MRAAWITVLLASTALAQQPAESSADAASNYNLFVAAEAADEVYHIAFDGVKARVERIIEVGELPTEIEGPHGLTVGPDGKYWYMSLAHGKPFGSLCKYDAVTNELMGTVELGMFPATMQISDATGLLYCVNFNLHGRMLPSSISIVDPDVMVEVARTTTGPMPHGSRLSPDGRHHYSCAMMAGYLFEIDAVTFKVKRRLQLDLRPPKGHESTLKPTWVQPHPTRPVVYVALNGAAQIAEVSLESWKVTHRMKTAKGPYNLDVTPDGKKLVVSYKTAAAIGIWDLATRTQLAEIPATRRVTHGVAISPDGRYGFVSSEGVGAEKGSVDVLDLRSNTRVTSVDVGLQAGGIAFWKTTPR